MSGREPFESTGGEIGEGDDVGNLRPTFKLGDWEPPEQYNQPVLEPEGEIRTKEHKVLSNTPVIQKLGENAEKYTLRGDCFEFQIERLRKFRGEEVRIRHPAKVGYVLVERQSFSSTGEYEEYFGRNRFVYTYTMGLIEVD